MFEFEEVKNLLSKTAVAVLQDSEKYAGFAEAAAEMISEITGYAKEEIGEQNWAKVPFTFLLEYLVYNKVGNASQEYTDKIKHYYNSALETLERNKKSLSQSKTGTIEGLYDEDL